MPSNAYIMFINPIVMFKRIFHKIDLWTVRSVSLPGYDEETLLRKKIWWGLAFLWILITCLWNLILVSLRIS